MRAPAVRLRLTARVVPTFRNAMRVFGSVTDTARKATAATYIIVTTLFTLVMFVGVIFRYVLNNSLTWSDELALILFTWAIFLAAAMAFFDDKHVRLDVIVRHAPERWRGLLTTTADGVTGGCLTALLVSGISAVEASQQIRTMALGWPLTIPFMAIPVACALMLVAWAHRTLMQPSRALARLMIAAAVFAAMYAPFGDYVQLSGPPRALFLIAIFVITMGIGMPVALALATVALAYAATIGSAINFDLAALQLFYGTQNIALVAVPLLVTSGMLMHEAGIGRDLVGLAELFVGRLRGGLAAADVVASLIFADISGSAVSDTAAIGSVMIPAMKGRGYEPAFTAALQAAAGTLGYMFPPAITLLLYGVALNVSITHLFAASLLPGFLVAGSFIVVGLGHGWRHNYPREAVNLAEAPRRLLRAVPGLFAAVIILGGILGGVFTPAEAGVVLLIYILLVGFIFYRMRSPARVVAATMAGGNISGMMLFLVSTAAFVGWMLNYDQVSSAVTTAIGGFAHERFAVLAVASLLFIGLGSVLEAAPLIFGFMPTFLPVLAEAGVDPVQWGVLFVIQMGIGMLIPPVALMLNVSSQIAGVRIESAMRAAIPFVLIMLLDLVLVAVIPGLTEFLPSLLPR